MTLSSIQQYLASLPKTKGLDLEKLHQHLLRLMPNCQLWFLEGKDEKGKVISNPNIGYGEMIMPLAGGKSRKFYQIGISANTGGISVYIMGIRDKNFLSDRFAKTLGKAKITGYCIKFKKLSDIDLDTLSEAIKSGLNQSHSTMPDKKTVSKSEVAMSNPTLKNGDSCIVIKGTHQGKSGIVQDLHLSKTGHLTLTVLQQDGVRFKTLGRNVEIRK